MAELVQSYISCGVDQAFRLNLDGRSPEQNLKDIWEHTFKEEDADTLELELYKKGLNAFIVFSDVAAKNRGGRELARYIKKNFKKGELLESRRKKNPNSGNRIRVWLWGYDRREFLRWGMNSQ